MLPSILDARYKQQRMTLLKLEQFYLHATTISILMNSSFLNQVHETLVMDNLVFDNLVVDNGWKEFKFMDDPLYFEVWLYILKGPTCLHVFNSNMISQLLDISNSTKHWNSFLEIVGSFKCWRASKNLCSLVTFAVGRRTLDINLMSFYNDY